MSIPVELARLGEELSTRPDIAYLVTVSAQGPHVVSVRARLSDGVIVAGAGRTTRANLQDNHQLSLLFPAGAGEGYCLIVDGTASPADDDEQLAVTPTRAVLHRTPAGDPAGPSCVPLLDQREQPVPPRS